MGAGEKTAIILENSEAEKLLAQLSTLAHAAQVFGSGMADVDVTVTWSLEEEATKTVWTVDKSGRKKVMIQLDLNQTIELLRSAEGRPSYTEAFKAGFLHELGHILHPMDPTVLSSLRPGSDSGDRDRAFIDSLPPEAAALLENRGVFALVQAIRETLEDARVEKRLVGEFRGARRYLQGHAAQALRIANGQTEREGQRVPSVEEIAGDRITRLVALLFLQIWGLESEVDPARLPTGLLEAARDLKDSLLAAAESETEDQLTPWIVRVLLPALWAEFIQMMLQEPEEARDQDEISQVLDEQELPGEAEQAHPRGSSQDEDAGGSDLGLEDLAVTIRRDLAPPSLLEEDHQEIIAGAHVEERSEHGRRVIVLYPDVGRKMVVDEIVVAHATEVPVTERSKAVLADVVRQYGPMALEAFRAEANALRVALEVNYESRYHGRYRSGKRVGIANMRRYMVNDDVRLFQRIEIPDKLSYYFYILVDVSPSMLSNQNAQKAIATGYAFTEALSRLRIPVDVSMYSSAVTELYDHAHDPLDLFFGGRFGYLSAGTHEIEAIAYAKQKADRVAEERKIFVVITDGHPSATAASKAGAPNLRSYYWEVFVPWLQRAGIDLLGVGIGAPPLYHPEAVAISSGWDSVSIFMRLLDEIIARGRQSHEELWR